MNSRIPYVPVLDIRLMATMSPDGRRSTPRYTLRGSRWLRGLRQRREIDGFLDSVAAGAEAPREDVMRSRQLPVAAEKPTYMSCLKTGMRSMAHDMSGRRGRVATDTGATVTLRTLARPS
jgi:hypothetical protein